MKENRKKITAVVTSIITVIILIFGFSILGSNNQGDVAENILPTQEVVENDQSDENASEDTEEAEITEDKETEAIEESEDTEHTETEVTNSNMDDSSEDENGAQTRQSGSQSPEQETHLQENERQSGQSTPHESVEENRTENNQSNNVANNETNQTRRSEQTSDQSSQPKQSEQTQQPSQPKQSEPSPPAKPKEPVPQETVGITITKRSAGGNVLSTDIPYQEGDTALDVSLRAMQNAGLSYSLIGSGASAYMEGIDGLFEFDEGPLSGWKISVNGSDIDRSAGVYPVNPNDQVVWYYTTNYLED